MRAIRLAVAAACGAFLAVLGAAAPAVAHVTIEPTEAVRGGFVRLVFRVPNESDTASTTKLEVVLPRDKPISSVQVQPVPGWRAEPARTGPGAPVTQVTWTALSADAAVRPGNFQDFPVFLGPLPEADRLVFRALQTYSDGTVVRWIEEPSGGAEPEFPAPVLALTPATPGGSGPVVRPGTGSSPPVENDGSGLAVGLGVAGLVAGVAGLALGGLAFARTRRPPR